LKYGEEECNSNIFIISHKTQELVNKFDKVYTTVIEKNFTKYVEVIND